MQGDNINNSNNNNDSNDSNDANSRNDRHVVLIGSEQKTRTVRPSVFLANGWEEHFSFQDFLGFKNWDNPDLKKRKRGFILSKFQTTCLVKIDEEKLVVGSFSDLIRGLMYTGLFALARCNNLNSLMIENQISKMRITKNTSNDYIEELLSKIKDNNEDAKELFRKYGNHYICKKYYRERFGEELVLNGEHIGIKISKNIQKLCFEITEAKPNINSFKVEENKETKSISLWVHREMVMIAEQIQSAVCNKEFIIAEILRGGLLLGLYIISQWIIKGDINNEEQNVMKIIGGLEKIIVSKKDK